MHKVYSVRKEFVHWNRKVFGRIEQEINQKKRLLQDLQNNVIFMEDVGQERESLEKSWSAC